MSGTGDAGSTVSLKDASDTIVGTATIGTDGSWLTTLPNGFGELTPTFTDINGNAVVGTPIYYNSYVFGIQSPADGSTVNPGVTFSGHGQPNSPVTIKDADGTVLGTTVAEPDGSWSVAQSGPFLPGTHNLTVLNTTSDGTSTSTPLSVNLVAPDAPLVDPSDGRTVTGTAEPGSTITIRDGGGNVLGTAVTGDDGTFTFTPVIPFADGTTLSLTATDAAGNESPATTVTVDAVAPDAPVVDPSDGRAVTGTAEPGSTITVRDEGGNVIGTTVTGDDGKFTFTPVIPFADGTTLSLTAADAAGNESPATTVTVDAGAPDAPVVDPSDGRTVTGTAEPGSTITIRDGGGNVVGTTVADGGGRFTFTPVVPFADGTALSLTATDAAGNESPATTVTVDAVAPDAPVVDPSDGRTVTGTAEPGSTITIRDGGGNVLGSTVTGGDGRFTFTPVIPFGDGTTLAVTATDAAGNESPATTITVDAPAPATPPTSEVASDLAHTGSDTLLPLLGGIALITIGLCFYAWRIRRRTSNR